MGAGDEEFFNRQDVKVAKEDIDIVIKKTWRSLRLGGSNEILDQRLRSLRRALIFGSSRVLVRSG